MFKEYDAVQLKRDLPEHDLKAGTRGAIVMVHHEPYRAYEVELIDEEGWTLDVLTLKDEDLLAANSHEVQHNEAA